tara:strand:+ start:266 stop:571 length:306 start_codon:yes stop_codon:yes gene_type:complete
MYDELTLTLRLLIRKVEHVSYFFVSSYSAHLKSRVFVAIAIQDSRFLKLLDSLLSLTAQQKQIYQQQQQQQQNLKRIDNKKNRTIKQQDKQSRILQTILIE